MAWKNLTFILIPHSQSKIKQYKVHRIALISVATFMIVAICIMIFYIIGFQSKDFHSKHTLELNKQNEILSEIISEFDSSLAVMSTEIDSIEATTERIRKESNISDKDFKSDDPSRKMDSISRSRLSVDRLIKYIDAVQEKSEDFDNNFKILYEKCMKNTEYLKRVPSIRPALGYIITDFSSVKRPDSVSFNEDSNSGVSIVNIEGTPIVATADGIVSDKNFSEELGLFVVIDHLNGYKSRYGHMLYQGGIIVKQGDRVSRGDVIGYMGRTGSSTLKAMAPNVIYSVIRKGKFVDPIDYFFATDASKQVAQETPLEQIQ